MCNVEKQCIECEDMSFSSMKNLDMDTIKGVEWAEDLWNYLQANMQKSYLNWVEHVRELSNDPKVYTTWVDVYKEEIEKCANELLGDIEHLHARAIDDVEQLLSKLECICKELRIDIPIIEDNHNSLFEEKKLLMTKVDEFESLMIRRKEELAQLQTKQIELCNSLGKHPKVLPGSPLPNPDQILDLRVHIENLEREKYEREEKYLEMKGEILKLMEELQLKPTCNFEYEVVDGEDSNFAVTDDNMKQLEEFYKKLIKRKEDMIEEINEKWNKIDTLWNALDVDMKERSKFIDANQTKSIEVLCALKEEIKRLDSVKKENIKVFIEKYKTELFQLWDKCHDDKKEFTYLKVEFYTEELLELYELEIQKWKKYYEENKTLLKRIEEYKLIWANLEQLEKSADAPNRYKNRGGKLLQEERERNKLQKKIPLLESELRMKANNFFERTGTIFHTWGETIDDLIMSLHNQQENERKQRMSARKMNRDKTLTTPGKSSRALFPSTQSLARQTPDTANAKRKMLSAASSDVKKKPRVDMTKTPASSVKKGPKKVVSSRVSLGKEIRRKRSMEQHNQTVSSDYEKFQMELSQKSSCRSTLYLDSPDVKLPVKKQLFMPKNRPNIVVTPNTPKTPKLTKFVRPPSTPKSVGKFSAAKLTNIHLQF